MPILSFQCQKCGLSFKKRTKSSSHECECGNLVYANTGDLSVGFKSDVDSTMAQDTGMESLDLNFDRVIGEDARQKWDAIYQRRKDKWDLLNANQGVDGSHILRTEDGNYVVNSNKSQSIKSQRDYGMDKIKEIKNSNSTDYKEK
jgi:predicted  nucleic acid-binding Zn-ribbon protein